MPQHWHGATHFCRAASKSSAARVRNLEAQLAEQREAFARKLRLLECKLKVSVARPLSMLDEGISELELYGQLDALAGRPVQAARRAASRCEAQLRTKEENLHPPGLQEAGASSKAPQTTARPSTSSSLGGSGTANARPVGRAGARHDALRVASMQLQQKQQRVRRLEADLAKRDSELEASRRQFSQADARANETAKQLAAAQAEAAAAQDQADVARAETAGLRQAVEEQAAANEGLQAQALQASSLQRQLAAQGKELAKLHETEAALAALQQAQAEQAAAAQRDRMSAVQQAQRVGREAAADEWRTTLQAAEAEALGSRARVSQLEAELGRARAGLPWTPSAADYAMLERRMLEVEAAAQHREVRWRGLAEAAAREATSRQEQQLARSFDQALAYEAEEVGQVRSRLERLLGAVQLLHCVGSMRC